MPLRLANMAITCGAQHRCPTAPDAEMTIGFFSRGVQNAIAEVEFRCLTASKSESVLITFAADTNVNYLEHCSVIILQYHKCYRATSAYQQPRVSQSALERHHLAKLRACRQIRQLSAQIGFHRFLQHGPSQSTEQGQQHRHRTCCYVRADHAHTHTHTHTLTHFKRLPAHQVR